MFENIREDWQTYEGDLTRQGLWVMLPYRFGRWRYGVRPVFRKPLSFLYKVMKLASQILTGIDLPCEVTVGRRFRIEHFGGIIVSGDAVFGDDVIIRNGVTVGLRRTGERGAPVLGHRVDIGAGAAILGAIHVGDDVSIGANAVVLSDIPSNSIAIGVPAQVRPRPSRDRQEAVVARSVTVLFAMALFACSSLHADDFKTRSKDKTNTETEILKQFSAPVESDYVLNAGDEISVQVWGRPELSGQHVIGPDGRITLPVVGLLKIGGLSRDDAQKAIQSSLERFYTDLAVTFKVDKYSSYHIYVLGRVGFPGALQFETQPTLIEALTRADPLPVGGVGSEKAGLVRCAIFRGHDRIVWVDLRELFGRGNLSLNIRLARNDVVYLPDADDQLIYVLGFVQHPGAFRMSADMSFLDAFSLAGGLSEDADSKHIALIRPQTGDRREIAFKDVLSARPDLNASLKEGDIIYVPERGTAKVGYILQKTSPLTMLGILARTVAP